LSPAITSDPLDGLSGQVEHVTFHNEENGFAILKVLVPRKKDLVTVVGTVAAIHPGEWITAEGRWIQDRNYGRQLKADQIHAVPPHSLEGIERYLGSGLIKGIGPTYAKKLVQAFGEKVFDIIDQYSKRLEEVGGIGPERRKKIKEAWAEQKSVREIMVFLHTHGVGTSRAVRIYKAYGDEAVAKVKANPYVLARDIQGIGFATADALAQRLGFGKDSVLRAAAGLRHTLLEQSEAGHCALPQEALLENACRLLEVDLLTVKEGLARLLANEELVADAITGEDLIYLPYLHRAEVDSAAILRRMAASPSRLPPIDLDKAIAWAETKTGKQLAPGQKGAISLAFQKRLLVITGGPGVGKTTLLNSLLLILHAKKVKTLLCAPTGRAAKRLAESTGLPAQTIHRLLGKKPDGGDPRSLHCDVLIVDESSMIDLPLFARLMKALHPDTHLILVGDIDQLPSVGPGLVLSNAIESGCFAVARLTEIFRQAADSRIITGAHRINEGQLPEWPQKGEAGDFYFMERSDAESIRQTILELASVRLPAKLHCDPKKDIQILAPMNRGSLGTQEMNRALQEMLNPANGTSPGVERFGWIFRAGDKVIQTRNNYDKEVFNGDIGQVAQVHPEDKELEVRFDQRTVLYDFHELDELNLAYAITIHKSQGSEFPVVIIPLAMQQFLLLQRNLLYTGVTRGKKMVVLVGENRALRHAVRNAQSSQRYSGLLTRLKARE